MSVAETMTLKLKAAFDPATLDVQDVSEEHRDHGGWREGGETHFHIAMTSKSFNDKTKLEMQRAVNKALAIELSGPVHALSMEVGGV